MVEQIFLSPQVKRSVIVSNKLVYRSCLTSCRNEITRKLGKFRKISKLDSLLPIIAHCPVPIPSSPPYTHTHTHKHTHTHTHTQHPNLASAHQIPWKTEIGIFPKCVISLGNHRVHQTSRE